MAWQNARLSLKLVSIGVSLKLIMLAGLPLVVQAQSTPTTSGNALSNHVIASVTFEPPNGGQPNNTAGGASRGGLCSEDPAIPGSWMSPLMPSNQAGLTVTDRPTFFVYVPQTSAKTALFVLKDETEDYDYTKTIPISRTAGIISVKLPSDAPALEVGKRYKWSFVLLCNGELRPDSPGIEGQIQRVAENPTLSNELKNSSPLERAALYGKDGIWYDTLTSLAELRRSQPDNTTLAATWEDLLKSVGLEAIATKPLLQ